MDTGYIKFVANYLRKSRGDSEADLDKHRKVLRELCLERGWKYIEYLEIGSGDSIYARPVFQKLLTDIENGLFDAVCVMDIDRLGRGDMGDQDKIKKVFIASETYVITPQQIYDLSNDDDEFVVDMKSFIARREYKQIVKRLTQGKRIGSRMGMWTNGNPPYPYEYERYNDKYNPKGLVVNDEKLKIYRHIVSAVVNEGTSIPEIVYELNSLKIPSPKNSIWNTTTIYRLLIDETHLGKIISNKTIGDGHKKKKNNAKPLTYLTKDQWVIVNGCHEAVKTQDEHENILMFMSRRSSGQKRKPNEIRAFTGLVKCGQCDHTMTIGRKNGAHRAEYLKSCWYRNPIGELCHNEGMKIDILYNIVNAKIYAHKEELVEALEISNVDKITKQQEDKLSLLETELSNKELALNRILEAFEGGAYTLQQFKERKQKAEEVLNNIKNEIEIVKISLKQNNPIDIQNKISLIDTFAEKISNNTLTDKEKNKLYKSIISSIIWVKHGQDIQITINFR